MPMPPTDIAHARSVRARSSAGGVTSCPFASPEGGALCREISPRIKPAPRAGAKRPPARPRPDTERKPALKKEAAAAKTTVKRPKKVVKEEPAKPEGEKKE